MKRGFVMPGPVSVDHPIIVGMRADPEPEIAAVHIHRERAITQADSNRPVTSDLLEMQGWMARIAFQKRVVGIGQFLNWKRQPLARGPEFR